LLKFLRERNGGSAVTELDRQKLEESYRLAKLRADADAELLQKADPSGAGSSGAGRTPTGSGSGSGK